MTQTKAQSRNWEKKATEFECPQVKVRLLSICNAAAKFKTKVNVCWGSYFTLRHGHTR